MKLHEIASKDREVIEKFLQKWEYRPSRGYTPLKNYRINNDGTIEVDGNVVVSKHLLIAGRLPPFIKFGIVNGTFAWMEGATSFRGSPEECVNFSTEYANTVSSFEHFPKVIHNKLLAYHEGLTSFEGISDRVKHIGEEIAFYGHAIKSGGIGLILTDVAKLPRGLDLQWKIIEKYLGKPDQLYDCQYELIENGFEEYARL